MAVFARFCWACCNMIDQHISRYFGAGSTLSVVLLENFMVLPSMLVMVVVFGVPSFPGVMAFFWIFAGAFFNMLALAPYIRALQIDEARNAMPLFEITPVFVLLLAWALWGEAMARYQFTGAALIIVSGFLFVWDFNTNRLKVPTLFLISLSAFLYALNQLAMSHVSQIMAPWDIAIFFCAGVLIGSTILALCRPDSFRRLVQGLRAGKTRLMGWACLNEILARTGFIAIISAFAAAPTVGHVAAFSGTHPVFVFILTAVIGVFNHRHFPRVVWDRDTQAKIILLMVMAGGIILLRGG